MKMKTEYTYIHFVYVGTPRKTQIWYCYSNSSRKVLGTVKWYGAWQQYCFFPQYETVFNKECLEDVNDFITKLMEDRKNK